MVVFHWNRVPTSVVAQACTWWLAFAIPIEIEQCVVQFLIGRTLAQYELYTLEGTRKKIARACEWRIPPSYWRSFRTCARRGNAYQSATGGGFATSRDVRISEYKIVQYLTAGDRIGQPVLFGTRADFLDQEVLQRLKSRAGKSYTLTSQAHAGGDVVRAISAAKCSKQVVVCDCKIDEICTACERTGDQNRISEPFLTELDIAREFAVPMLYKVTDIFVDKFATAFAGHDRTY